MNEPVLSLIVPAYNEEATVGRALNSVLSACKVPIDLVVVDDGSTDKTSSIVSEFAARHSQIQMITHPTNRGKGAAIRSALPYVRAPITAIQDADLEYDPADLLRMLRLFSQDDVDVVYGSRRAIQTTQPPLRYRLARGCLSGLTNILYGSHITDEPTCYKMFRTRLLCSLNLRSTGFEFCPEVTAKLLKLGYKIHEVPISYCPRSIYAGKKIRFVDGVRALTTLLRLRFASTDLSRSTAR